MATYECEKCGMSVNATCGKCDAPLLNDSLELDDGRSVQISRCPIIGSYPEGYYLKGLVCEVTDD